MKKLRLPWLLGLFASVLIIAVALGGVVHVAAAPNCNGAVNGPYGRSWFCSYFLNQYSRYTTDYSYRLSYVFDNMGQTHYQGITPNWQTTPITQNSFIAGIQNRLFDTTSVANEGRAAAIVDIMLGKKGGDFGGSSDSGIAYAQANWNQWVGLVTEYASGSRPGYSVNFNEFVNFANVPFDDGMGLQTNNPNGLISCAKPIQCLPDIAFDNLDYDPTPDFAVVFHYPGGEFIIKDKCANLSGDLEALPPPVPPAAVSCAGLTTSIATPGPDQNFTLKTAVAYKPGSAAAKAFGPDAMRVQITGPPPYRTFNQTASAPSVSNGTVTGSFNVPATRISGAFRARWQVTGPYTPHITCSGMFNVALQPFFDVLGGDLSAGQGFGGGCSDTPAADIKGYNMDTSGSSGNYFGASSRQAAIATGVISGFASDETNNYATGLGGGSDGTASHLPNGLTESNLGASPPVYGGHVLGTYTGNWCVPDYVAGVTAAASYTSQPRWNSLRPNSSGYVVRLSGNQSLGNITLRPGVRVTVIVTGSAYVDGNITYANYAQSDPAQTLRNIPQFNLLVSGGDIFIDPHVSELHGFYAAQPSAGQKGRIFTCADGNGQSYELKDYSRCGNPLTVYGAVAATQIVPDRTAGNLQKSGSVPNTPAEQIVYTPELWLGSLVYSSSGCAANRAQGQCIYQAYTSLPPVL